MAQRRQRCEQGGSIGGCLGSTSEVEPVEELLDVLRPLRRAAVARGRPVPAAGAVGVPLNHGEIEGTVGHEPRKYLCGRRGFSAGVHLVCCGAWLELDLPSPALAPQPAIMCPGRRPLRKPAAASSFSPVKWALSRLHSSSPTPAVMSVPRAYVAKRSMVALWFMMVLPLWGIHGSSQQYPQPSGRTPRRRYSAVRCSAPTTAFDAVGRKLTVPVGYMCSTPAAGGGCGSLWVGVAAAVKL